MFVVPVIISMAVFQAKASCPPTTDRVWVELGNFCYHISKGPMNWGMAQEYCWGQGGYLAEIMSQNEENLLETFLVEGATYWLGLTDFSHEGT